ncbi:MAG: PAS domain S-box protein [Ghiorsea sp.]|nr:PAS domain S-box protein [Ghiorsea sp.]
MTQATLSLALLSVAFTWLLLKNINTSYHTYLENITLRIQSNQRENQLKKFYSAFEHAQDAIIISDLEARLEYVNPAFERMTGYSAQEAIGQFLKILRSDKHPPSFYSQLEAQDNSGKPWQGEMIIKCKDGSFLEIERTVSPVFDDDGKTIFLVAIQRDLTEHKHLENQFLQAQKMEAIGTLVGGIAHDFNNILTSISGNTFLLKNKIPEQYEANQRLEYIEQSTDRAASLVQQMLTFARKDTVSMTALNLNELTNDIFALLRTSLPENITLKRDIEQGLVCVEADKTQIHQVLLNLVNNARDALLHVQEPKVTIQLSTDFAHARLRQNHPTMKSENYAHLSVQDNGSGIPKRILSIFLNLSLPPKKLVKVQAWVYLWSLGQ